LKFEGYKLCSLPGAENNETKAMGHLGHLVILTEPMDYHTIAVRQFVSESKYLLYGIVKPVVLKLGHSMPSAVTPTASYWLDWPPFLLVLYPFKRRPIANYDASVILVIYWLRR